MFPHIEKYLDSVNQGKIIKVRIRKDGDMSQGSLWLDYYHNGVRKKATLKLYITEDLPKPQNSDTVRKAVLTRDKKEIELAEGRGGFVLGHERAAVEEDVYTMMRNWYKNNYAVEASLRSHRLAVSRFEKFMRNKDLRIHEVTKNHLRDFRKWLIAREHRNYARHLLSRVCVFFNKMEDDGVIDVSPARRVSITELPKDRIVYLDIDEITKIAGVTYEQVVGWATQAERSVFKDKKTKSSLVGLDRKEFNEVRQTFLFQCFSGLRISDARAITPASFVAPGVVSILMQKTKRPLNIPIHPTALAVVTPRLTDRPPDAPLFDPPRSTNFSRVMFAIGQITGITKKLESRIARRSFASLLVQNNVSIYDASKMLGHASVKMTEKHYASVGVKHLQEELGKVPTFDVMVPIVSVA